MKNKILNQIQVLKQQYEDLISKEIRTVYNEFVSVNQEQIQKILSKEYIPLFFLERAFVNWIMENKRKVVKGVYKKFLLFDNIVVLENSYSKDFYCFTGKWCDNLERCSGNEFHQLPYFDSEGLSFSIFTVKDFPELIPYASFNPSVFIQLDFENVGKKNCFIYPTKTGCIVNSYGDWENFNVPFEDLKGISKKKIRTKLMSSVSEDKIA